MKLGIKDVVQCFMIGFVMPLCGLLGGLMLAGCSTTEIIETVLGSSTNSTIPAAITNIVPDKPVTASCSCDLSKGWGAPLVPKHGATDKEVNDWLRHRWAPVAEGGLGLQDSCGGLQNDVRPLLVRLTRGTFGYKYVLLDKNYPNRPRIEFDGKGNMRAFCGDFEGERYHPIGKSDKEWDGGNIPGDFEEIKPGVWTPQKHFVSFRKVNL